MAKQKNSRSFERKLLKVLNAALSHQIANRGTDAAFYKCYTYPRRSFPQWVKDAEKLIAKPAEGGA